MGLNMYHSKRVGKKDEDFIKMMQEIASHHVRTNKYILEKLNLET